MMTSTSSPESDPRGLDVSVVCGSRVEWIDPMQALAERIFALAGFEEEESYWPILAVREAVMNAVLHGNQEQPERRVRVRYRVSGGRIEVRVCDQGEGFDPGDLEDPLSAENLLSDGGRGVYMMRQFMDEVRFSFPDSGGTCICLVKRIPAQETVSEG